MYARSILPFILGGRRVHPYSNNKIILFSPFKQKSCKINIFAQRFLSFSKYSDNIGNVSPPLEQKASKQIILFICEAKAIWFAAQVFMECFMCSIRESLYQGLGGHSDIHYISIVFDIGVFDNGVQQLKSHKY